MQFRGIFCLICPVGILCYCSLTTCYVRPVLWFKFRDFSFIHIFSPFFFFFFFVTEYSVQPLNKRPKDRLQFIFKLFLLTNSNEFRRRVIFSNIWIHKFVKQVVPIQQEQPRVIKVTRQSRSCRSAFKVLEEGFFLLSRKRRSVMNMKLSIFHSFLVK